MESLEADGDKDSIPNGDGTKIADDVKTHATRLKVTKIPPGTSADALHFFFENTEKYGGGDVENVELGDDGKSAIIKFKEEKAVGIVLTKIPIIFKKEALEVEACNEEKQETEDQILSHKNEESVKETHKEDITSKEDNSSDWVQVNQDQAKSTTFTEPTDRKKEMENLVQLFSLSKFFPGKITLQDVRSMQSNKVPLTKENLPWLLLMKLIIVNTRAREEDLDNLLKEGCKDSKKCEDLNPMDLFLVTFLSCDPILQQEIVLKLIKCQLAIPFTFRDSNNKLRWSKLSMKKTLVAEQTKAGTIHADALNYKGKVVAFLRIGDTATSKSKLLNAILSDQSHPTFYNVDCPLGNSNRLIANGTIEASWYIPKDDQSGPFKESILFLNLRGDAMKHEEEFSKILLLSNIVVIHSTEENMEIGKKSKHMKTIPNIVTVYALETSYKKTEFNEKYKKKINQRNIFFSLKDGRKLKSLSDVASELKMILSETLPKMTGKSLAEKLHYLEDKNNNNFSHVEKLACSFEEKLKHYPKEKRNIFVPFQGELWYKYSKAFKENYKAKQPEEKNKLENDLTKIRKEQLSNLTGKNSMHPLMQLLYDHLKELCIMNQTDFCVYIEWIMSYLDDRSRRVLPICVKKYNECWKKMKEAKEDKQNDKYITLKTEVLDSEKDLIDASFGMEHLIRELGQMFEASRAIENDYIFEKNLAIDFACKILQYGYPFEIMDGDTAMLPLTWVKAVLQRLIDVIGDQKILAISVLGIQSSGKSTMLNAMFGLKFPVSAGRCTRGVYLQLVKVDNKKLPFTYILVIDTEGLRAPELANQCHSHDNELATFVIGIGNITIINIKGENTAELEDVLQIAVHAFLRLKMAKGSLNMNHTCIFTHQNVSAANASDANAHGRKKMVDKLDLMTSEAANQEGLVDIKTFNQVIKLDPETNVYYFSDLFMGDPPMAPVNVGYSKKVQEVRENIIFKIATKTGMILKLSETIVRIEDLWKGILTEDFVFNFRNSLEVKAYNEMEIAFFKLIAAFDNKMYTFIREDVRKALARCENDNQLERETTRMKKKFIELMATQYGICEKNWNEYIDNCSLREISEQWREHRLNKLRDHKDDCITEGKKKMDLNQKEFSAKLLKRKGNKQHQNIIKEKAIKLATEYQGKGLSKTELNEKFEDMWDKSLASFDDHTVEEEVSVEKKVDSLLFERFVSFSNNIFKQTCSNPRFNKSFFTNLRNLFGTFPEKEITNKEISHTSYFDLLKVFRKTPFEILKKQAYQNINIMFADIDSYIRGIENGDGLRFEEHHVTTIFNMLNAFVDNHNKGYEEKSSYTITKAFRVKLAVFVARYVTVVFTRFDAMYREKNSIEALMNQYKITIKHQFEGIIKEENEALTLAKSVATLVKQLCVKDFKKNLPAKVAEVVMTEELSTKHTLILEIMRDLAEKEEFEKYQLFIARPKSFALQWITDLALKKWFTCNSEKETKFSDLIKTKTIFYKNTIEKYLHFDTNNMVIKEWITEFQKQLSTSIEVSHDAFDFVEDYSLSNDTLSFPKHFEKEIESLEIELKIDFEECDWREKPMSENPFNGIINKLWGCEEKCIFCGEICQKTDKDHSGNHRCIQHRPGGINGCRDKETRIMSSNNCHLNLTLNKSFNHNCHCLESTKCTCEDGLEKIEGDKFHPYKEYAKYFPDWDIEPNPGMESSAYWKWFVYRFKKDLEIWYGYIIDDSVDTWQIISKEEALASLQRF